MAQATAPKRRKDFTEHWNPEVFRAELKKKDRSIRKILEAYATEETGWQGLYRDVVRWRKEDPTMEADVHEHIREVGKLHGGGRNRLDQNKHTDGWEVDFCKRYAETSSKFEASKVTPYKYSSILAKLNPAKTEYNAHFKEMVDAVDSMMAEEAVATAMDAMREANKQQLDPKTRAWIALGIAKIAKGSDWSAQKVDITHSGTIKFEAKRALLTSELAAEQRRMFSEGRARLLPSGERISLGSSNEAVLEAELVEEAVQ